MRNETVLAALAVVTLGACGGGGSGRPVTVTQSETGTELERESVIRWDLDVADLNGDGLLDMAVAEQVLDGPPPHAGSVTVILQRATEPGSFESGVTYQGLTESSTVAAGDFDGDGHIDLVAGTVGQPGSDELALLLQDPARPGRFVHRRTLPLSVRLRDLAVADLNSDGVSDLITAGTTGAAVLLGDPSSPDVLTVAQTLSGRASSVAVADLNGDGAPDAGLDNGAVESASEIFVQAPSSEGEIWLSHALSLEWGMPVGAISLADLDGDGRTDVIVSRSSTVEEPNALPTLAIALQEPAPASPGSFLPRVRTLVHNVPRRHGNAIVVADLDGDGHRDVAMISSHDDRTRKTGLGEGVEPRTRIAVLRQRCSDGMCTGALETAEHYLVEEAVRDLEAGDMNGDGLVDLVVSANGARILFNRPAMPGTFEAAALVGEEARNR